MACKIWYTVREGEQLEYGSKENMKEGWYREWRN